MRRRLLVLLLLAVVLPVVSGIALIAWTTYHLVDSHARADQRGAEAAIQPYLGRVTMRSARAWSVSSVQLVDPGPREALGPIGGELVRFGANPFGGLPPSGIRLHLDEARGEVVFLGPAGSMEGHGKLVPLSIRLGAVEVRAARRDGGWEVTDATAVFLDGRSVNVLERLRAATPEAPLDLDALRGR